MRLQIDFVLKAAAAVCGAPGLGLVLFPEIVMGFYGLLLGAGGVLGARILGSALVSLAVVFLWSLRFTTAPWLRGVLLAGLIYNALDTVIIAATTLAGTMGLIGWIATLPHLLLTLGFGLVLLRRK